MKPSLVIKVSRPIFWIVAPIAFYVGFKTGNSPFSLLALIQMLLLSFPYCLMLFGINDIYDYESDKNNPRKKNVQGIKLKKEHHASIEKTSHFIILLLLLSAILTLNPTNVALMIGILLISYYYSVPPRLREMPPLDSLSNGLCVFLFALLGSSFGTIPEYLLFKGSVLGLCAAAIHSFASMLDYEADKKAKNKTFAVVYGKKATALLCAIVFAFSITIGKFATPIVNYFLSFCFLIFLIASLYPKRKFLMILGFILYIGFMISGLYFVFNM